MQYIYVLLFLLLLNIFFGTIVDMIMLTLLSTQVLRIKIKVIYHTFVAPIIFGLAFFFAFLTNYKGVNIIFGAFLIIGTLIRIFYDQKKYLTDFKVGKLQLEINYLSFLLKEKHQNLHLTDISYMDLAKANKLIDYPASLSIKHKGTWLKFHLNDKELKKIIQCEINTARHKEQ